MAHPSDSPRVGVSGLSLYVPRLRVPLEAWCQWTGNPWEKIRRVVGRSFRMPAPHEDVYTMAASAAQASLFMVVSSSIQGEADAKVSRAANGNTTDLGVA